MPDVVQNGPIRLAVERRGSGTRDLLFAHGWISARRMWYEVAARLDLARYRLHLLDFRGCGDSDRPATGHDMEGYASDLRAAIAAIGGPFTLVGHSMGGKIAQYVAAERPAGLDRLILIAPGTARAARVSDRHRATAFAAIGSRERIAAFQRAAMVAEISPAVSERILEDALVAQPEHWKGWYEAGRTAAFPERLAGIAVPTLVLAGDGDPVVPAPAVKRDVAGRIPGARMVVLRSCGHNVPVERPAEVAEAIEVFHRSSG